MGSFSSSVVLSPGRVEDVVRDQIVGPLQLWTERLALWQRLRKVLEGTDPEAREPGRGRKRKLEQGEGGGERSVCGGLERVEGRGPEEKRRDLGIKGRDFGVDGQGSGIEGRDPGEKGRGPDEKRPDPGDERLESGIEWRSSGIEKQDSREKRRGLGLTGCDYGVDGQGSGVERRDCGGEAAMMGASRVEAPPSSGWSSEEGHVSEPRPAPVSFRVCCRSSGSVARKFSCQVGVSIVTGSCSDWPRAQTSHYCSTCED